MTWSPAESALPATHALGGFPGREQGQKQPLPWVVDGSTGSLPSCSPRTVVDRGVPGADRGLREQAQCVVMGDR